MWGHRRGEPRAKGMASAICVGGIAIVLGLAAPGEAPRLTLAQETRRTGRLPVNPDGGLKAKGHPIGATGVSQAYEVFAQLRGQAGARQVPGASHALTHNVGGAGATAAVTVFSVG